MNKCISVEETSEAWTITLGADVKYVRLVGSSGILYNVRIIIASGRTEDIRIDLVNASLFTTNKSAVIASDATCAVQIGMYGETCAITGRTGDTGENGALLNLTTTGGTGENGFSAVAVKGDFTLFVGAENAILHGGNGGKGGKGRGAIGLESGHNGGKGGDGAYAISASSVTVVGVDGYRAADADLAGGLGGSGGAGGKGAPFFKDGKTGATGESHSAATVEITYK